MTKNTKVRAVYFFDALNDEVKFLIKQIKKR